MSDRKAIPIEEHLADDSDERGFIGTLIGSPNHVSALIGLIVDRSMFGPVNVLTFDAVVALINPQGKARWCASLNLSSESFPA